MFSEILVLNPWKSPVETARSDTAPCGKMFVVLGEIAQGDPSVDGSTWALRQHGESKND